MAALAYTRLASVLLSLPVSKANAHVECGTRRFGTIVERTLPTDDCASRVDSSNETVHQGPTQQVWRVMMKTCLMSMILKLAFVQLKISLIEEFVAIPSHNVNFQLHVNVDSFCMGCDSLFV